MTQGLRFRDLRDGDRFRFVYGLDGVRVSDVLVKGPGRWYSLVLGGRRFTTGARVTVRKES